MFLMRDGTLISLFHGDAQDVCKSIVERLQVRAAGKHLDAPGLAQLPPPAHAALAPFALPAASRPPETRAGAGASQPPLEPVITQPPGPQDAADGLGGRQLPGQRSDGPDGGSDDADGVPLRAADISPGGKGGPCFWGPGWPGTAMCGRVCGGAGGGGGEGW